MLKWLNLTRKQFLAVFGAIATIGTLFQLWQWIVGSEKAIWFSAILFVASVALFYLSLRPSVGHNTLSIEQAESLLQTEVDFDRVRALYKLLPYLENNISGADAEKLLSGTIMESRTEGIRIIAHKLSANLSKKEPDDILSSTVLEARTEAISYILNTPREK